jgi:hypothetical protein
LIAYYRRHGLLRSVDGMKTVESVAAQIEWALLEKPVAAKPEKPVAAKRPRRVIGKKSAPTRKARRPKIVRKSQKAARAGVARKPKVKAKPAKRRR